MMGVNGLTLLAMIKKLNRPLLCAPWAKTYAHRHYDDEGNKRKEKKKAKGTKKCVIKNDLKCDDYKDSALKNKIILRSQQRFKSDHHNVFTEEINKVAISSNDDKRIQDFDGIIKHAFGTPPIKICESELLAKMKVKPIALYYSLTCEFSKNIHSINNWGQYLYQSSSQDFGGNTYSKNNRQLFSFSSCTTYK